MKEEKLKKIRNLKNNFLYYFFIFYTRTFWISTGKLTAKHPHKSKETPRTIIAIYHESVTVLMRVFRQLNCDNPNQLCLLVSGHQDGDLVVNVAKFLGLVSFRLQHRSVYSLKRYLTLVREKNYTPVIAIDGPVGPYRTVQEGVLFLQEELQLPIQTVLVKGVGIRLKTWDRHLLPLPASRVKVHSLPLFFYSPTPMKKNRKIHLQKFKEFLKENH